MLDRAQIEMRIPHAGSMCLLEQVTAWNATRIVCQAAAPTADHPFAKPQGGPAVAAVEYAAQAAALHGALLEDRQAPRGGMLAKLADVELAAGPLDKAAGKLTVLADLLVQGASGCMYSFMVQDDRICRARGRLLVAFTHDD